jgi:hypothetical protein
MVKYGCLVQVSRAMTEDEGLDLHGFLDAEMRRVCQRDDVEALTEPFVDYIAPFWWLEEADEYGGWMTPWAPHEGDQPDGFMYRLSVEAE